MRERRDYGVYTVVVYLTHRGILAHLASVVHDLQLKASAVVSMRRLTRKASERRINCTLFSTTSFPVAEGKLPKLGDAVALRQEHQKLL